MDRKSMNDDSVNNVSTVDMCGQFFELLPVPCHILSPDGLVVNINTRWVEVLGYKKADVTGKSIFDFVPENKRENEKALFDARKASKDRFALPRKACFMAANGQEKWFFINDALCRNDKGGLVFVSATLVDVPELQNMDKSLPADTGSTGDVIARMRGKELEIIRTSRKFSHDLNNAVMPILGLSDLVAHNLSLIDNKAEMTLIMQDIAEATQNVNGIILRMRTFYRQMEEGAAD